MNKRNTISSCSTLKTVHGVDYFDQLCTHFAKRAEVDVDGTTAHVAIPIGTCALQADQSGVHACVTTTSNNINRMEEVFGGWIERMAFREQVRLTWRRGDQCDAAHGTIEMLQVTKTTDTGESS